MAVIEWAIDWMIEAWPFLKDLYFARDLIQQPLKDASDRWEQALEKAEQASKAARKATKAKRRAPMRGRSPIPRPSPKASSPEV